MNLYPGTKKSLVSVNEMAQDYLRRNPTEPPPPPPPPEEGGKKKVPFSYYFNYRVI